VARGGGGWHQDKIRIRRGKAVTPPRRTMPLQTRSIRMWSGVAPPPEIITRPAINTARALELGSTTGEAALGRFTGPPACAGSLTLPRCAKAAEAREITAAISLRRAEGRCMGPPGQSCCQAAPSPRKAGAAVHQCIYYPRPKQRALCEGKVLNGS